MVSAPQPLDDLPDAQATAINQRGQIGGFQQSGAWPQAWPHESFALCPGGATVPFAGFS